MNYEVRVWLPGGEPGEGGPEGKQGRRARACLGGGGVGDAWGRVSPGKRRRGRGPKLQADPGGLKFPYLSRAP